MFASAIISESRRNSSDISSIADGWRQEHAPLMGMQALISVPGRTFARLVVKNLTEKSLLSDLRH